LTIILRSCIVITSITTSVSIVSFLLIDPLADIMIVDRVVGYSKYNEPLILITEQGLCLFAQGNP
jgi:hypothetical protein